MIRFLVHGINRNEINLQRLHPEQIGPDYLSDHLLFLKEDKFENPLAFPVMNIAQNKVFVYCSNARNDHVISEGRTTLDYGWSSYDIKFVASETSSSNIGC